MWKPSEFRATEQGLTVSTLGAALMYKSHTVFSGVLLANVHLCVYTDALTSGASGKLVCAQLVVVYAQVYFFTREVRRGVF